ncbi:hypothetical protein NEOKW01_0416 [Nematocida sp. AWRm80]|nr:hypothetical protein NEOKW01_0416 [Nematocida sp. AWRm80]
MSVREYIYNGETIFLNTPGDGAKIYWNQEPAVYIAGNSIQKVPAEAKSVKLEHLELSKKQECKDAYCVSNALNTSQETITSTEIMEVKVPFETTEFLRGNYIEVVLVPDKCLPSEAASQSVVAINGIRMVYKRNKHRMKIAKLPSITDPLVISVDYQHIQYIKKCSVVLPHNYTYTIGLKKYRDRAFIRLTLLRLDTLDTYAIELLNPLFNGIDIVTDSDILDPEIDESLAVCCSTRKIDISAPERITELFFEVKSLSAVSRSHKFFAKVNGFLIQFWTRF